MNLSSYGLETEFEPRSRKLRYGGPLHPRTSLPAGGRISHGRPDQTEVNALSPGQVTRLLLIGLGPNGNHVDRRLRAPFWHQIALAIDRLACQVDTTKSLQVIFC
jgi:hypothetical protein